MIRMLMMSSSFIIISSLTAMENPQERRTGLESSRFDEAPRIIKSLITARDKNLPISTPHIIIGGAEGSGKSYAAQLIACALGMPTILIDCKKIIEETLLSRAMFNKESFTKAVIARLFADIQQHSDNYSSKNTVILSHLSSLAAEIRTKNPTIKSCIATITEFLEKNLRKTTICLSEINFRDLCILSTAEDVHNIEVISIKPVPQPERMELFRTFLVIKGNLDEKEEKTLFEQNWLFSDVLRRSLNQLPSTCTPALINCFMNHCLFYTNNKAKNLDSGILQKAATELKDAFKERLKEQRKNMSSYSRQNIHLFEIGYVLQDAPYKPLGKISLDPIALEIIE